jgi:RsiG-like
MNVADASGNRRIDRIRSPEFVAGLAELDLDQLRGRRDECMAERERLSLLRRMVQGRAEILVAELDRRGGDGDSSPLVDRLSQILSSDEERDVGRGEALRFPPPDDELALARRAPERLVADAEISDPGTLSDERLAEAVHDLLEQERAVSQERADVIHALDVVQEELKRRYKQDPSAVLA